MRPIVALGVASLFFMGASATAGTSIAPEPAMVTDSCSVCHGTHGISPRADFPNLAAQPKSYIETEIKDFQDHTRGDHYAKAFMWSAAGGLPHKTIDEVATYFSTQPAPKGAAGANPAQVAAGKTIFANGISSENVPACGMCHGTKAAGTELAPRLAGQHREYLLAQLKAFRSNARNNAIMHGNVEHMTDQQMRNISAYLASL